MLSSLRYFRDLEHCGNDWIGDRLEGSSEVRFPEPYVLTENSPELHQVNHMHATMGHTGKFADVISTGQIIIRSQITYQIPDCHIFSFCSGDLEALRSAMQGATDPYTACLRIKSPMQLFQDMLQLGQIPDLERPAAEVFKNAALDRICYESLSADISDSNFTPPSPFKKPVRFQAQQEHRLVLEAPPNFGDPLPDRIVVQIPNLQNHFEIVLLPNR